MLKRNTLETTAVLVSLVVIAWGLFSFFNQEQNAPSPYPEIALPSVPSVPELPQPSNSSNSFAEVKPCYVNRNDNIFYNKYHSENALKADLETFTEIDKMDDGGNNCYGKDKNNVYFKNKVISGANPETFIILNKKVAISKDDKHVFRSERLVWNADPETISIAGLASCGSYGDYVFGGVYIKDNKRVYHYQSGYNGLLLGANPATFVVEDTCVAKDKSHVYYSGYEVPKADPETFVFLELPYAKDKNNVYWLSSTYGHYILDNVGLDAKTFQVLSGLYTRDANNIFTVASCGEDGCSGIRALEDADVSSFIALNDNYAKDKNNVYLYGYNDEGYFDLSNITSADPFSFFALNDDYARDKNSVFYQNQVIKDADSLTFVVLGDNYSKDKNNIYFQDRKVAGADVETFKVKDYNFAEDKNNVYKYGEKFLVPGKDY